MQEILKLSLEERIIAAQTIWDSIEEKELGSGDDEQFGIIEKRLEEYLSDPSMAVTWEQAKVKMDALKNKWAGI